MSVSSPVSSLAPAFLISMPQLVDPNFARTVVLLCKHGEDGAFGLVVNRPMTSGRLVLDMGALIAATSSHSEPGSQFEPGSRLDSGSLSESGPEAAGGRLRSGATRSHRDVQIWIGGPVEPESSRILVAASSRPGPESPTGSGGASAPRAPEAEDGFGGERIAEGLYLSASLVVLRRLLEADPPPRARLIAGYSGWGPGQLEAELHASAWLIGEVNADLIFETSPDLMWEAAIRRMGADPAALQISRGVH